MLRWLALAAASLAAVVAVAILGLLWLVDTPALRLRVAQVAGQALGRPVTFASISVRPLPLPTIHLRGVEVADDPGFGAGPMLTLAEGRVGMRFWPLVRGRVEVTDVTLSDLRLQVVEDAAGRLNVAALGAAPSAAVHPRSGAPRPPGGPPPVALAPRVRVVNGAVRYRRLGDRPLEFTASRITATLTHDAPGAPVRLRGEALVDNGGARVTLVEGSLAPVAGRPLGEAALVGTVEVETGDAAGLVRRALESPEVQGAARGRFQVAGTLGRPSATGTITLDRAMLIAERRRCGEPPRRRLPLEKVSVPLTVVHPQVVSEPVTARMGGGSVSLRATVQLDRGPVVTVKDLRLQGVEAGVVLVDYLCQPWGVRGPLDLTGELTFRGPDYAGSATGAGRLKIGRGAIVGRDVTGVVNQVVALTGAAAALARPGRRSASTSPLDFESITASYTVAGGVVKTGDLVYEGRGFRITGAGTYGLADGRVGLDAVFTQGDNEVRATIAGAPGALTVVPTSVRVREGRDLRRLLDKLLR